MVSARETLRQEISLRSLFGLAFGTIIGFIGGGLLIAGIGLCYAEVSTMYPVSGGEVAYVYEAWGTRWSFAAGWALAFICIFVTSFEAISLFEPYRAGDGDIPVEWIALGAWAVLGGLLWRLTTKIRAGVRERERRWLILGEDE